MQGHGLARASNALSSPVSILLPGGRHYLDTETFYDRVEGRPSRRAAPPPLAELKVKLDKYLADLVAEAEGTAVNRERATILAGLPGDGGDAPGLFP